MCAGSKPDHKNLIPGSFTIIETVMMSVTAAPSHGRHRNVSTDSPRQSAPLMLEPFLVLWSQVESFYLET